MPDYFDRSGKPMSLDQWSGILFPVTHPLDLTVDEHASRVLHLWALPCPSCGNNEADGRHEDDCKLIAAAERRRAS